LNRRLGQYALVTYFGGLTKQSGVRVVIMGLGGLFRLRDLRLSPGFLAVLQSFVVVIAAAVIELAWVLFHHGNLRDSSVRGLPILAELWVPGFQIIRIVSELGLETAITCLTLWFCHWKFPKLHLPVFLLCIFLWSLQDIGMNSWVIK
jgi:hypothetical protein